MTKKLFLPFGVLESKKVIAITMILLLKSNSFKVIG